MIKKIGYSPSATCLAALILAGAFGADPAVAQSTEPAAVGEGAASESDPDEIVVTAQRREQSLQGVGIAITALNGDSLSELAITETVDIGRQVPNLTIEPIAGAGTQPAVFLRGVGLNDFSLNNSGPVGLYYDEVYLSSFSSQNFLLFDIDRIEVLRGPQGTLYGRNTTGGAINFISNRPTDTLDGYAQAVYGQYDRYELEGAVGGPLVPGLNGRIAVARHYSEGFFVNEINGNRSSGVDLWAFRAMLEAEPIAGLNLLLRARADINNTPFTQYERYEAIDPATGGVCSIAKAKSQQCVDALGYTDKTPRFRGRFGREEDVERDVYGISLKASMDLGSVNVTSITAYEWGNNYIPEETDASPLQLVQVTLGADTKTLTQELRVSGETGRLNWIAGAYYLDENTKQDQGVDLFRELRPIVEELAPEEHPGGFDPGGEVLGAPIFKSRHLNDQQARSFALFGQGEFGLTEQLTLIAGLRYTAETRDFETEVLFEEPGFNVPLYQLDLDYEDDDISGKLGLNYQVDRDLLLYASLSKGFKAGGFNGGFLFSPDENKPYGSEILWAYEGGLKWTLPNRLGRFNVAGFYYDYQDLQVFTLINTGGVPITLLDNAASAEIYGLEAELVLRPVRRLNVSLGAGFLRSRINEWESLGSSFVGNDLPRSPEFSFNGVVTYEGQITPDIKLIPQVDFTYTDDYFYLTDNQPIASQEAHWLVNAQLTIAQSEDRWSLSAFVRNVFDQEYTTNVNDLADFGFYQVIVGAPRMWGLRGRFNF